MRLILALLLFVPSLAWADPPKVEPEKVAAKVGVPFLLRVEPIAGKKIGIDGGLDAKTFSSVEVIVGSGVYFVTPLEGSQGTHRVRYWTIGDKITRTVTLTDKAPDADAVTIPLVSSVTVVVGGEVQPPPKKPDDPTKPPPTTGYYFMLIRSDGAADPAFTKIARNPAWAELVKAGHLVKDFGLSDAIRLGAKLPDGTPLPCVVTLRDDGTASRIVRGPVPLPTTSEAILELAKGVGP